MFSLPNLSASGRRAENALLRREELTAVLYVVRIGYVL
jgi:hypothetical protein